MRAGAPHVIRLAGALAFIVILHVSALLHEPLLGASAAVVLVAIGLTMHLLREDSRYKFIASLSVSSAMVLLLFALASQGWSGAEIVYFPPILFNAYFAVLFGRSLAPGREALITRFRRLERGDVPAVLARYTRNLTVIWTALLMGMTVELVVLAVLVDLETWSWYANVLNPLIAATFFVIEHPYRFWRYSSFGPYSLKRTFDVMLRRESWMTE